MKVIVTGDRNWSDVDQVMAVMRLLPVGSTVINGGCRGADEACAEIARALGHKVRTYPADWGRYNRGAGPVRNERMLSEEHTCDDPVDACIAFHNDIAGSRGTRDMVARALRAGIATAIVTSGVDIGRSLKHLLGDKRATVLELVDRPGSEPGDPQGA